MTVRTERTEAPADTDRFPEELLSKPVEDRLQYFWDKTIRHPLLDHARETLISSILIFPGGGTINVYGPAAVGKTTLANLVDAYFAEHYPLAGLFSACRPILRIEAADPQLERFSWKAFFANLIRRIDEQYPHHGIELPIPGISRNASGKLVIDRSVPATDLRRAAELLLREIRPRAVFIDEAPHMNKLARGARTIDQMDIVKSLTDATGVVFVLIGTYAVYDMANLNGQQGRRSRDVHFPRYTYKQLPQFKKVLRTMQNYIPLREPPNLENMADFIYEKSVGCVGVVKIWMYAAYQAALKEKDPKLTKKVIVANAFDKGKLLEMGRDIREGERKIHLKEHEYDTEVRALLGMSVSNIRTK